MNVTFLIGNGFDLACGMQTSYPAVYEEYIKTPSATPIIEQFKADLIKNKTKENWGNWSDFEMGMAQYAEKFDNEQDFITCIADFKKFLRGYLLKEQAAFKKFWGYAYKEAEFELQKYISFCVSNFYLGASKKLEREIVERGDKIKNINFVSFNYTTVLDMIIRCNWGPKKPIYHIHGTLEDGDVTLGIDEDTQIKNRFSLTKKGKRVFVKPFFNNEEDPKKVEDIKQLIIESEYICAFGLSFGDSDLTWKNAIIEWLKSHKDHHLFLYDYGCSKIEIDDIAMRRNEEETQKSFILSAKNFCQEDSRIFEQIHIPIGDTIFDFVSVLQAIADKKMKTA